MLKDRRILRQRLKKITKNDPEKIAALKQQIETAISRKSVKLAAIPTVTFAGDLPIHGKLDEIRQVLQKNQLVIVCGETGSGKTTQLPKLCLDMGMGTDGLIGHTQPRRLAARSVATRLAEELHTSIGKSVGFKVRYTDVTSETTCIKLMTDGILLAELQKDRYLENYDTLIIDEAHERSLNIDFILGYLKQLLPKRPDLKVIITSATIDIEKFSAYFENAPVIEVSGRSYPVEVRYRPVDGTDTSQNDNDQKILLDSINELSREGQGDILIFLEGEREIHETAKFLVKSNLKNTGILPLYSHLSSARQAKIFHPHKQRHIILATNIAETSITIPGIRYVIDRGYARISRYNRRSKVQQLPIEKISRASAEQRKGRCGRIADGICIRLYSETDYESRPEFTDPEILRTNLASVILQMKSLCLGEIRNFPFINMPDTRFINDGVRLLLELKALDKNEKLTSIGKTLARLPLDPRLGRILIASNELGCLREILTIISALSVNDPRERPLDMQQKADETHEQYKDKKSDFLFFLNLWDFYQNLDRKLSQNKLRKFCQQNFISYIRMREWKEVRKQLQQLLSELKIYPGSISAEYHNIHSALLYGFLGQIAVKTDEKIYLGARGIKLGIFPGSGQFKRLPKWIVSAELVETSRIYCRTVATIEPHWILKPAEHLLQREYSAPYWDGSRQQVMASEKITLYGLVLVTDQKVNYGKINPEEARVIFINNALVEGDYQSTAEFLKHNQNIVSRIKMLEKKSRRNDILNEDALFEFYNNQIPPDIYNGPLFEKWYKTASRYDKKLLFVNQSVIMYHDAGNITGTTHPDSLKINGNKLNLEYTFNPDDENDGINLDLPFFMLNQVNPDRFDFLVPGLLEEKVTYLLKGLPKSVRKNLVPIPDIARNCAAVLKYHSRDLIAEISDYLFKNRGINIPIEAWNSNVIPEYLKFNIRLLDESGKVVASSRNIETLRRKFSKQITAGFRDSNLTEYERDNITYWNFGELPETIKLKINTTPVYAYPALVDNQTSVSLKLFDTMEKACSEMRNGLKRLIMLELRKDFKYLQKNLHGFKRMSLLYSSIGNITDLEKDLIDLITIEVFLKDKWNIRNKDEFENIKKNGAKKLMSRANEICQLVILILEKFHDIKLKLSGLGDNINDDSVIDINDHMNNLVFDGFIKRIPLTMLANYPRYLEALNKRIDKIYLSPEKDMKLVQNIIPYWSLYKEIVNKNNYGMNVDNKTREYRVLLEEYRVSLFAQELGTSIPVSAKRLEKFINVHWHRSANTGMSN